MTSRLNWLLNRLRRMGGYQEYLHRLRQAWVRYVVDRWYWYSNRPEGEHAYAEYPEENSPIVPVYRKMVSLGDAKCWSQCPKTAEPIPAQQFCWSIGVEAAVFDFRHVCVFARLHALPAIAYGPDAVAFPQTAAGRNLVAWLDGISGLRGPWWRQGIEVAIRALNLCVFSERMRAVVPGFNRLPMGQTIERHLAQAEAYLRRHRSLYSSANNHLVAELFGRCVLARYGYGDAAALPELYETFQREILAQVALDGFSREQSLHYHVEVASYCTALSGLLLKGDTPVKPGPEYVKRVIAMADALDFFDLGQGTYLGVGDDDEGHLLYDPFRENGDPYRAIKLEFVCFATVFAPESKGAAARYQNLFRDSEQKSEVPLSIRVFWPELHGEIERPDKPFRETDCEKDLPESGYFRLDKEGAVLLFDHGPIGLSPLAAHGHSDIGSVQFFMRGRPVLIDSGTYQYFPRAPFSRNDFKGVRGHNTVSVSGLDQAKDTGRMMWGTLPEVRGGLSTVAGTASPWVEHDGFRQQGVPVSHRRTLDLSSFPSNWEIRDEVFGGCIAGSNAAEIFLNLAPMGHPHIVGSEVYLSLDDGRRLRLSCEISNDDERSPIAPFFETGFYSPQYDIFVETMRIVFKGRLNGSRTIFCTRIFIENEYLRASG